MSEIRALFEAARPYGAKDPVMDLREGEGIQLESAKRVGVKTVMVDATARLPDGITLPFKFFAANSDFYRRSGPKELLRPGHYRHMRTEALKQAIERVSRFKGLLPASDRVKYGEFPVQSARVEEVRVGPLTDPESLAVFVELLTGDGKKIAVFGVGERKDATEKARIKMILSDEGVFLDAKLTSALEVLTLKELRRLGVSV